jgi:hypothetical protein
MLRCPDNPGSQDATRRAGKGIATVAQTADAEGTGDRRIGLRAIKSRPLAQPAYKSTSSLFRGGSGNDAISRMKPRCRSYSGVGREGIELLGVPTLAHPKNQSRWDVLYPCRADDRGSWVNCCRVKTATAVRNGHFLPNSLNCFGAKLGSFEVCGFSDDVRSLGRRTTFWANRKGYK